MNEPRKWLIRTKSNKILGPVSRIKIIELMEKNALSSQDELCSANGFWFYTRERDLVKQYIVDNEAQPYNLISEAKSVLTAPSGESDDKAKFPSPEDLEFPTIIERNKVTGPKVEVETLENKDGEFEPAPLEEEIKIELDDSHLKFPDKEDLDYPEATSIEDRTSPGDRVSHHAPDHFASDITLVKTQEGSSKIPIADLLKESKKDEPQQPPSQVVNPNMNKAQPGDRPPPPKKTELREVQRKRRVQPEIHTVNDSGPQKSRLLKLLFILLLILALGGGVFFYKEKLLKLISSNFFSLTSEAYAQSETVKKKDHFLISLI